MRVTLRTLWRSPGFAIAAILTLALGIGANTAIFSVIYGVLLKPLPFPEPDRLVRLTGGATVARFEAIEKTESYTGTAASMVFTEYVTLVGADAPESLKGVRELGIRQALGASRRMW